MSYACTSGQALFKPANNIEGSHSRWFVDIQETVHLANHFPDHLHHLLGHLLQTSFQARTGSLAMTSAS